MNLDRRDFLRAALPAGATATGLFNASAWQPLFAQATASHAPEAPITERTVGLDGDSPPRTYEQHIVELQRLMAKGPYPDVYLKGGAVTEFEQRMASLLGKEDAAFFPTGTLANNIAVRLLCGERRNLLIQHEAHLYQDEGQGPSLLSGINMIPLAPGKALSQHRGDHRCPRYRPAQRLLPHQHWSHLHRKSRSPPERRLRPLRRGREDHQPRTLKEHRHSPRWIAALPALRNSRLSGQNLLRSLRYRLRLHLQVLRRSLRSHPRRK